MWLRQYVSVARSAGCAVTGTTPGNGTLCPNSANELYRIKKLVFYIKVQWQVLGFQMLLSDMTVLYRVFLMLGFYSIL